MPTIRDVAALASVSVGTVSNMLNKTSYVHPTTAARILNAVEALKYRPNALARSLRKPAVGPTALPSSKPISLRAECSGRLAHVGE